MKNILEKVNDFKNVSRNLFKHSFDMTIVDYLISHSSDLETVEHSLKGPGVKNIMNIIKNEQSAGKDKDKEKDKEPSKKDEKETKDIVKESGKESKKELKEEKPKPQKEKDIKPEPKDTKDEEPPRPLKTRMSKPDKQTERKALEREDEEKLNNLIKSMQSGKDDHSDELARNADNFLTSEKEEIKEHENRSQYEYHHTGHTLQKSAVFDNSPHHKRTIYLIHEGDFAFMSSNQDEEAKRLKVSLMNMESAEILQNFPKIPAHAAKMIARLDLKELEPYIDKIITSDSKNFKILVGWFQATDSENTQLNDIANYLKKHRRAGRCKYFQNSTIYSLHIDDLKPDWLLKYNLDLSNLTNLNPKIKPSSLAYLIVSKNYKPNDIEPPFEPQVVVHIEDDHSLSSDTENNILDPESPAEYRGKKGSAGHKGKKELDDSSHKKGRNKDSVDKDDSLLDIIGNLKNNNSNDSGFIGGDLDLPQSPTRNKNFGEPQGGFDIANVSPINNSGKKINDVGEYLNW